MSISQDSGRNYRLRVPSYKNVALVAEKASPLFFKRDVEHTIRKVVDYYSDALVLARATRIVRCDMFSEQSIFNGSFPADGQGSC